MRGEQAELTKSLKDVEDAETELVSSPGLLAHTSNGETLRRCCTRALPYDETEEPSRMHFKLGLRACAKASAKHPWRGCTQRVGYAARCAHEPRCTAVPGSTIIPDSVPTDIRKKYRANRGRLHSLVSTCQTVTIVPGEVHYLHLLHSRCSEFLSTEMKQKNALRPYVPRIPPSRGRPTTTRSIRPPRM